jgi:hypothetical protein
MNELSGILSAATAAVEHTYFQLNIDGGDPVFRERVYCYELYHQMRSRWPSGGHHVLNGEIDKRAHPILKKLGADYAKPDFLIHTPGAMAGNHAIIEVKHSIAPDGIRKDLTTLDLFVRTVGYQRAIYLIYGWEVGEKTVEKVSALADEFPDLVPIEIWLHSAVGQPAIHNTTLQRTSQSCALPVR